jgi:hypothetical protein
MFPSAIADGGAAGREAKLAPAGGVLSVPADVAPTSTQAGLVLHLLLVHE